MTQALANVQYKPTDLSTERLGEVLVKSGFFKDVRDEAQAIVKILYGREVGFGPIASVMGVYIVNGRPSLAAQLIASAVQRSGLYRYRVREWTDKACRIEFFERGESLGESVFTIEDAQRAELVGKGGPWKQYPKAMLWARAMSQGARAFTPEVFNGSVYTPDELGATVNAEGDVIDIGTGEVIEERTSELEAFVPLSDQAPDEDRDLIRQEDDEDWQGWLKVQDAARAAGVRAEDQRLPADRRDLKAYATSVANEIRARRKAPVAIR